MTRFLVVIHKRVAKAVRGLPRAHQVRLARFIEILATNPLPWKEFDLKRIGGSEDTYRVRLGDWRLVYFVDRERHEVHVLVLETRAGAYA